MRSANTRGLFTQMIDLEAMRDRTNLLFVVDAVGERHPAGMWIAASPISTLVLREEPKPARRGIARIGLVVPMCDAGVVTREKSLRLALDPAQLRVITLGKRRGPATAAPAESVLSLCSIHCPLRPRA